MYREGGRENWIEKRGKDGNRERGRVGKRK